MTKFRKLLFGCGSVLVVSLLLARVHPFGDAELYGSRSAYPTIEQSSIPPEVRVLLASKCADCHSMQARPPLYGRLAPASWLMERDIVQGRKAMNLSLWQSYSDDQRQTFKAKIAEETRNHRMPLLQYRFIHWNRRVTSADVELLSRWTRQDATLDAATPGQRPGSGDPVRGREVFEKRCTGCHALEQDREGPRLKGVYGRTSGTVPGFSYSTALRNAHIVWNETSLEKWLTDPDALVPGTDMEFHVAKPQERVDIVRFLEEGAAK